MTTYSTLRKIIPADQALANKAVSRALGQVKDISNTTLSGLARAAGNIESNKGLDLINDLTQPIPADVSLYWSDSFADGTGPGNTITISDMLGTAAGDPFVTALPVVIDTIDTLQTAGNLAPLTANGGSSGSATNGVYTLMLYTISGAYSTGGNIANSTTIPATAYFGGGTFTDGDEAFSAASGLIANAGAWIANISSNNQAITSAANTAWNDMAGQMVLNVENCGAAGLEIGNIVLDMANANLISNSTSSVLNIVTSLHSFGQDVTEGGAAQWWSGVANIENRTGQAVIGSLREGRNITALELVNVAVDTQLSDIESNPVIANTLAQGQYTVAEARANLQY